MIKLMGQINITFDMSYYNKGIAVNENKSG